MMNQSTPVGDLLQVCVCVWGGGRGEGGRGGQMDVVCMVVYVWRCIWKQSEVQA